MFALWSALCLFIVSTGSNSNAVDELNPSTVEVDEPATAISLVQLATLKKTSRNVEVAQKNLAGVTSSVLEYADHKESVCQGQRLDCVHLNGVSAACYAERISYSLEGYAFGGLFYPEGFIFEGGKHLFRAMFACMLDPECGGFSVAPDNTCTFFYRPGNFSWNAAPSTQPGWHCWEKRQATAAVVPETMDNLTDSIAVNGLIDAKWNESLHALNSMAEDFDKTQVQTQDNDYQVHEAQKRLWKLANFHAQKVEHLINDFGWSFVAPITWTVMSDGNVYLNSEYANGKVQEYNQTLDHEVAALHSSMHLSLDDKIF